MWTAFLDRLSGWPDITVLFGLNLLLQSTLIILIGLTGAWIMGKRRKGASAQSLMLRICLVCVFLAPPVILASSALGVKGLYLSVTMRKAPAVAIPLPMHPSFSPNPVQQSGATLPMKTASAPAPKKAQTAVPPSGYPVSPLSRGQMSQSPLDHGNTPPSVAANPTQSSKPHLLPQGLPLRFSAVLMLVWAALSLFLALRTTAITLYIRRIRLFSSPALPEYTDLCRKASLQLGISVPPVLQSPYVTSTLLTGLFRPAILLPSGEGESSMASNEIFLHELAHMARRDPLWLHLCQFAKILFPFQPLLWVLARRIEELSDYACDDYVILHTGGNRTYATQLFNLARSFHPGRNEMAAGSGILSTRFPLLRRIEHILDNSYSRHITVSANDVMSFSIIFLCAVTFSGFIGFREKNITGTAYSAEQPSRQNGENLLQKLSRLHVPLTGPLAALTMEKQQANASIPDKTAAPSIGPGKAEPERESHSHTVETPSPEGFPAPQTASIGEIVPEQSIEARSEDIAQSIITEISAILTPAQTAPASEAPDSTAPASDMAENQAKSSSQDSLLTAGWTMLGGSAAVQEVAAVASTGQVKIAVPNSCEGALKESLEAGQENPVWSPTGKVIAFTGSGGKGIWIVSPNGGTPNLIHDNTSTPSSEEDASDGKLVRTLCFSPDGNELTYVKYDQNSALTVTGKKALANTFVIESINLVSGKKREIMSEASEGCWSSDSKYFVYVKGDGYGINVLDTQTGTQRSISETGLSPCLTPDGASLIYVDKSSENPHDLFRVSLAGGTPEQLTNDGRWLSPKISPDGEWVLSTAYGYQDSHYAIFWAYNLKEHNSYFFVVTGAETAEMGTWSPSGLQYCYTRYISTTKNGSVVNKPAIYIDNFQSASFSQPTAETAQPHTFKLLGNYPNPFNPSTTIQFSLSATGRAELDIYNMLGQKIRSLVSERLEAGTHSVVWNGRDQNNKPVSSGIYVARLKMEGKVETRRMTLVK